MDFSAKALQQKLLSLSERLENPPDNEQQARQLKLELEDVLNDIKLISSSLDERA